MSGIAGTKYVLQTPKAKATGGSDGKYMYSHTWQPPLAVGSRVQSSKHPSAMAKSHVSSLRTKHSRHDHGDNAAKFAVDVWMHVPHPDA